MNKVLAFESDCSVPIDVISLRTAAFYNFERFYDHSYALAYAVQSIRNGNSVLSVDAGRMMAVQGHRPIISTPLKYCHVPRR